MPCQTLQKILLAWFAKHNRPLPWRQTHAPYQIWISEIMLQQTRMDRVVGFFNRWLERFPDIASLARASEDEVLKLWEGLGYYARARNILKTAKLLMAEHDGLLPADRRALLQLPGIGRYTAGAIMSLAFNRDCAIVDANVERLFARLYDIASPVKEKNARRFIWQKARELIPPGQARSFNQALMELGALVCLPKKPRCADCPVRLHCKARRDGTVLQRPVVTGVRQVIRIEMATGILVRHGKIFIQKRPETGVWANLWEFPGGRIEEGETREQALRREFYEKTEFQISGLEKISTVKHSYTKYRVTQHCFFCRLANNGTDPVLHAAQACQWVGPDELDRFAFPTGHRQLIDTARETIRAKAAASKK